MDTEEFYQLAKKVADATASDQELARYNHYFNHFQTLKGWDEKVMGNEKAIQAAIYAGISRAIDPGATVRKLSSNWKWAAAAAVLILILGSVFFLSGPFATNQNKMVSLNTLHSAKANDLIQLPDGSTVILSAGSELKYSPELNKGSIREVFLSGKAFFDIKHDPSRPFLVKTGSVTTQVLGTAFDVNARNGKVMVTVIRGKVVVNRQGKTLGTLTPNKQVVYDTLSHDVSLHTTNAEKIVSWREENLAFNDVNLQNAAKLLMERFEVQINIEDEALAQRRFSTTLFQGQKLEDFLTLICEFNNANYTYDKPRKKIIIKPN